MLSALNAFFSNMTTSGCGCSENCRCGADCRCKSGREGGGQCECAR